MIVSSWCFWCPKVKKLTLGCSSDTAHEQLFVPCHHRLLPVHSQLPQAQQEGPEERQRQAAAPPAGQGGRQHRGERAFPRPSVSSCSRSLTPSVPFRPAGAGFQLSAEEGLPERRDALWDAPPGCLHHPVAGPRPAGEIRERVQVMCQRFLTF